MKLHQRVTDGKGSYHTIQAKEGSHIYGKDNEVTTYWKERTQDKERDQGMKAKPVIGQTFHNITLP